MSVEVCLEILEQRLDREGDFGALFEELIELEEQTLEDGDPEDYHGPLGAFLERLDELFAEENFDKDIAIHAASNFRMELERIRDNRPVSDPLQQLFRDMLKFQNGTATASTVLGTLSQYEELVLALRHQFEGSTDPTDERETPRLMRAGLEMLEGAGKFLRQQLNYDSDARFDEIIAQFEKGAEVLREFRRKASFVEPEYDDDDDEEWEE